MCGIAGYLRRRESAGAIPVERLRAMTDSLWHRGPDDSGLWEDRAVGLGHRRLSIRDLTEAGRQPMLDPSQRVVVTFNGEIYNDRELRRELEIDYGVAFQTRTDTELLPAGFLAWGEALFERLEGMFAIGLWDRALQRLHLARDGIGIKPLYYFADRDWVIFGSEVKALFASGQVRPSLSPVALHTYLAAGYPGPAASLIQGVKQVPPGTVLTFSPDTESANTFWQPRRSGEIDSLGDAVSELCALLPEVVSSQLVSDVPVSVLQSGGIDSTLISLTLRQLDVSPPLFTAGFAERSHDESDLAAEVAAVAGLRQHVLPIDDDPDPVETFRATVRHFDGQCADTGAYAFYRLCGEVRRHSTVVLSGDGGDEFFAGYETYRASRMAERLFPWIPMPALAAVGRLAYPLGARDESRLPLAALVSRFTLGLASGGRNAHMQWRRLVPEFMLPEMYAGSELMTCLHLDPYAAYQASAENEPGDSIDRWLLADQRFHIQSVLAKVDAMSMAHGLEVRVPLLDRRIMDFAGRCSTKLLIPENGPRKYLLRKAAETLGAPQSILLARKKGFNVPIARMLRNELRPLAVRWFEHESDVLSPYVNPDAIRGLWRAHEAYEANHAFALWPLLNLAEWVGHLSYS